MREGTTCDGEPAALHLRKWAFDFELLADPGREARLVTDNIGDTRFLNDREVWVLAFAPIDAVLPLPPEERFRILNQHTPVLDPAQLPADVARATGSTAIYQRASSSATHYLWTSFGTARYGTMPKTRNHPVENYYPSTDAYSIY